MLTVHQLTKQYGNQTVIDNISFSLPSGKCIALIGPNGAGKTTTIKMLTGLMRQTSGTIQFENEQNGTDFRSIIGYLPQHPVFHHWMTGKEFLIYCAKLSYINKKKAKNHAEYLLEKVGIADAQNKRISTYSGGMKQRLGIAQAIIHQPKVLFLDEPVSALDPIGRRDVLNLMEKLKSDMTILFSTHILNDADEVSDELLLLHEGKIVESGSMNNLRHKYQTTKIELKFDDQLDKYIDILKALSTVQFTSIDRSIVHVTVTNIEDARIEILRAASEHNWPLSSFTVNQASLEDMFMKAVQTCNG